VHSLVDFPLQVPSIRLYVAVFLAIAWRPLAPDSRGPREPQRRPAPAPAAPEPEVGVEPA
jgi:hypothetical protein